MVAGVGGQARGRHGMALAEGESFPWESFKPCMRGTCLGGREAKLRLARSYPRAGCRGEQRVGRFIC